MRVKHLAEIVFWPLATILVYILNIPTFKTFQYQLPWRKFFTIFIPAAIALISILRLWQILKEVLNKKGSPTDDELVERELTRYKAIRPDLVREINTTLEQIKKIRRKFLQLKEVLKRNGMEEGFNYTIQIAQNTQEILADSIKVLLNKITICEDDMYDVVIPHIKRIMERNDKIVFTFNDFLMAVSNMQDDDGITDKMESIVNLTDTLKAQNEAYQSEIVIEVNREVEKC